jgi:excinuclease ABC subunit C
MATGQLWLFPPPKPLVERLGVEFFRQLPPRPGVYLMCGPECGVLYVGRARNLRRRLCSYRVANPERLPRRIIRLLHCVTRIEYDECPTESAAQAREEQLICVLAPRFNRAGKPWGFY